MIRLRVSRGVRLACVVVAISFSAFARAQDDKPAPAAASSETPEEAKERVTAERFLDLLKKRPRLGTALDKVYGYHVGRGSLEAFVESLAKDAGAANDGNAWLILGMVQMRRGQDAQAAIALEKAEAQLPNEALASYYLGKTLVVLGEVDKAAAAMRRAIDRKPARPDLLAIFQDLGRIYQRTGRNTEALEVWKQLETQFPGDAQVREQIASILAEEGATQAALDRYVALAATTKDKFRQVELAIRAAQLKAQLGKTEEALAELEAQLAVVNPDSWLHRDVRRRIEEMFWASGDVDGLVSYYTKWIAKHPDDVDAMMRTARALSAQRRLPEAEKWFRDAIAKGPSLPEPRLALVEALAGDDRYADAAKEMGQLVELVPDNPDYIVRWGELVFGDAKRTEDARRNEAGEIWRRMLKKRGDDPVTVARVADLLRSSATDAAIEQYRKAIELAPSEPQYREYLGEYLHQLGRKDEALATWRELASGERETRDNLVRLSEVLSTFHFPDEALATIAKACDMKPTFGHRARYAELLREAKKYDESLAQLDLAEPMAEDPELRELVIEERIKNFQASGKLTERIEETAADLEGGGAKDPMKWRMLALLRDADRKFQLACDAIDKAAELAPGDAGIWETAATLQERAGRFGDAVESFRKLATIDRRFLSNYLTQIASLEMRLGNTDAALKAGEDLLASAPGNSEHFRFFADLCFQTGNSQRGFDVLRRNVRANPNDEEALVYLARMLGEEFETDEAVELYWRAFELAKDVEAKIAVITPMTDLYLRTNKFDTLVERLETIGREANKPRDGLLWVAAAHQAAGDLGRAKESLERLVREDSRDVKLLAQLVTLARAEFDFETAAEYQKRLVAAAPSPEAEFLLGNILLELGEISEAEVLWLKLSQRSGDPQALSASIYTLLGKEEYATAAKVIEKAIARQPSDWELYAPAMITYVKLDRHEDARRMADRVLAMNVDPATPTKKVQEAAKKQTSRRNQGNIYDPYANLGLPSNLLQAGQRIKSILNGNEARYNPGRGFYTPTCFQDVQALAYCMPLVAAEKGFDTAAFVKQYAEKALESGDSERLWRALFYLTWQTPNVQYSETTGDSPYDKILNALIEKEDPFAATSKMTKLINMRRSRSGNDPSKIKPLDKKELDELKRYSALAAKASSRNFNYSELMVAMELARAGEEDAANEIIDAYVAKAKNEPNGQYATLQAMSILVSDNYNQNPSPKAIAKALELLKLTLADLKFAAGGMGNNYGQMMGGVLGQLVKHDRFDEAIAALDDILKWQAAQTALLRPSQRERMQSSRTPITYYRVLGNGRGEQHAVTFPPVSAYLGAEAILSANALYEACKDDEAKLAKLKEAVAKLAAVDSDNPQLRAARLLTQAGVLYWSGERDRAGDVLTGAEALQVDQQFIASARSRLLYESGKVPEALAVVEKLRPTNQQMLVDRELAILQLVLQRGDLDRARASAQKLFALRLESDTEFKLADLMYQLGMKELGDRMMGRIRRRAGGKQDTLVQLMTRYAEANDKASAGEIARQVIRRTSPRSTENYYTAENQQHEQAVRVLHQAGELDELIKQYEGLVERSPKSTKLVDKLCAFYEAAGRREDAQKMRLKSVENAPEDPRSLYAAAQQLVKLKKYSEAADKFTAAILKSPELLDRYYEMQTAFREAKAWNRLSDAIVKHGVGKFSQTYRLGELCSELGRQKDQPALNRILIAALSDLNWSQASQMMYSLGSLELKPDAELVKLMEDKLTAENAEFANLSNSAFVWSRSSDGHTSGFVDGVAKIVSADDALSDRVAQAMTKRLEKSPEELFPRVLMCLVSANQKKFDDVEKMIRPVMDKKEKNVEDGKALWCVASMLAHKSKKPDLACRVLESAEPKVLEEQGSSGFQWTAMALLAFSYEKAGRNADAHRILVEEIRNKAVDQTQSQYNPGYGEYQFMGSLCDLSERFLKMGYPAEAFIAWRKAFADPSMIDKAARWGSNLSDRRDSLRKQIAAKRTSDSMVKIIQASLTDADSAQPAAQAASFLTEPVIERNSLIDTRVTMPLAQFTEEIGEQGDVRQAVAKFLAENPLPEDPSALSLKKLVTRLLICDAARDIGQAATAATAIAQWVRSHEPPAAPVESAESAAPKPAEPPVPGASPKSAKPVAKKLPDELLLGMAALRMPESIDQADVVSMLERAIAAAKASKETSLASSLQCQIARHVAAKDPDRARTMLREALDELLPPDDKQASAAGVKEAK